MAVPEFTEQATNAFKALLSIHKSPQKILAALLPEETQEHAFSKWMFESFPEMEDKFYHNDEIAHWLKSEQDANLRGHGHFSLWGALESN